MKIIVLSDSHHDDFAVNNMKKHIGDADVILHCGDGITDLEYLTKDFKGDVYGVKGNCDISNDYPIERVVNIGKKKIFMCHGHMYNVKNGYHSIFYRGREVGADIVLFGHSHIGAVEEVEGIILMNPGSIAIAYGKARKSFGVIEIDYEGKIEGYLKNI